MEKRSENDIGFSHGTRETVYSSSDDDTANATVTEHPLNDAFDLLMIDLSQETSAPLSSLAFKKRRPKASSSSSRRNSTNGARRHESARVDARPQRRRHSALEYSREARKKNDADDISDAEQLIIQLKLELAEAKGEVEGQVAKINKLTKENERLNLRIKEYEVNGEVHQVTVNSLEDATLEIQELLRENQRLMSQVDTVTYQRNELKNRLGIMTVSSSLQKEEPMSSASTLEMYEETNGSSSLTDSSSQDHCRTQATSKRGSGCSLDHRASAMALMSSLRTSIRRISSVMDPEEVPVDELLWDDDDTGGDGPQQEQFAAQGA